MANEESDFGSGLLYCLGMFLAHQAKLREHLIAYEKIQKEKPDMRMFTEQEAVNLWAQGAGDHLIDFQTDSAPEQLKTRCIILKEKVLAQRFAHLRDYPPIPMTKEEAFELCEEAKEILRLMDEHIGIPTIIARWS